MKIPTIVRDPASKNVYLLEYTNFAEIKNRRTIILPKLAYYFMPGYIESFAWIIQNIMLDKFEVVRLENLDLFNLTKDIKISSFHEWTINTEVESFKNVKFMLKVFLEDNEIENHQNKPSWLKDIIARLNQKTCFDTETLQQTLADQINHYTNTDVDE